MSTRRAFLSFLGLSLLLQSRHGEAQQAKVFRAAFLNQKPMPKRYEELVVVALQGFGYVEGRNLFFERAYGTPHELPALASNLARSNLDVIVCGGSASVWVLMNATRTIPVVAVDLESDPIASGFASSLARPGGNLTGLFLDLPGFGAKRLEILKETLPTVSRVAALHDPSMDPGPVNGVRNAAHKLKLKVFFIEVSDDTTLEPALQKAVKQKRAQSSLCTRRGSTPTGLKSSGWRPSTAYP